jgi:hypothetical protein
MKTLCLYLLACAWCAAWFCSCGGAAEIGDISNQQSQNQTNEGDIQTAQEACMSCMESKGADESLNDCLISFGFDASDC